MGGSYGPVDPEDFTRVVHRALDLGVTFFDAAEAYGDAERVLGKALGSKRHASVIATKVGIKKGLKPTLSRSYVLDACDSSLKALGTDTIDLYQVHFDDPDTPIAETVAVLDELKAAGKIRHYGVGHLQAERVVEYCRKGDVFSVMAEFSAAELSERERLLPICIEQNIGMIAFSVTGRGILTGSFGSEVSFSPDDIRSIDPLFQRERFQFGLRVSERLGEMAGRMGCTRVQIAIAWVFAQKGVICALTGPLSIQHLEENLAAADISLHPGLTREFEAFLANETHRLREQQKASIARILSDALPRALDIALADLVYAMETALQLKMTSEAYILPLFRELLSLRNDLDRSKPCMDAMQDQLKALIQLGAIPERE